jgi:acetylornithine deacetylase/succinyl-diaminopimelate desuccinylase-like protein
MPSPHIERALSEFARTRDQHMQDLYELVRIPSVSFDGFPAHEVRRSADAVAALLRQRGFQNVRLLELPGVHPYVYGEHCQAPGKPTLLLYAHHDVQPAGDEKAWRTPPFEPTERDGRLYGRGTADDKAGVVIHTAALASYLQAGIAPPLNIKILVEGEEEIGSSNLADFVDKYANLLKADVMVLTDTSNFDVGVPSITTSLRGLCSVDIEVKSLHQSVHSGMWGGPLPDAGLALAKILASLSTDDGRIAVAGIYDRVRPLTALEEEGYDALPYTLEQFRKQAGLCDGVPMLKSTHKNPWISIWRQPSLAVNAVEISSRKDARNITNGSAWARVGVRLVPDMDPSETQRALIDHIHKQKPFGVHVSVHSEPPSRPWHCAPEHPAFQAAMRALQAGYGRRAVTIGCGGSIPFVEPLSARLGGVPALLVGVEDPYTNAHSENESLCIADWESAIRSAIHLYDDLSRSL